MILLRVQNQMSADRGRGGTERSEVPRIHVGFKLFLSVRWEG